MVELIELKDLNTLLLLHKIEGTAIAIPYANNDKILADVRGKAAQGQPMAAYNLAKAYGDDPATASSVNMFDAGMVQRMATTLAMQVFIGHNWGTGGTVTKLVEAAALNIEAGGGYIPTPPPTSTTAAP